MELTLYEVIKRPRATHKAYDLHQWHQQLVLEVHPKANKPLIAEALKKLFNVEAERINIVVTKGRVRRVGRHTTRGSDRKKAIVKLREGSQVNLGVDQPAIYTSGEKARTA
jgi:large subunit ribosomal protein L23